MLFTNLRAGQCTSLTLPKAREGTGKRKKGEEKERGRKKTRAHGEEAARNERFEVGAIRQVSSDVVGYARNKGGAERNRGGEARVETRLHIRRHFS